MELTTRRWLLWTGAAVFLMISVVAPVLFFAYWFVLWPISPKWVAIHSPWTAPQIRALGIVNLGGTDETVRSGWEIFDKSIPVRGPEVERGLLECLRSADSQTRWMAFYVLYIVAKHGPLSPAICDEIQRGIQRPHSPEGSVALTCVPLMPLNVSQPILRGFLQSNDVKLRWTGVDGLAKPGAFELTAIVRPWLLDEKLRRDAIRLLEKIRDPTTVELVRPYLDDPKPWVRDAAKDFLRTMEESSAVGEGDELPR